MRKNIIPTTIVLILCLIISASSQTTTQNNASGSNTSITGGYTSTSNSTFESGSSSNSTTTTNSTSNAYSGDTRVAATATAPAMSALLMFLAPMTSLPYSLQSTACQGATSPRTKKKLLGLAVSKS